MVTYTHLQEAASAALVPFQSFLSRGSAFAGVLQPVVVLGLTLLIMSKGFQALRNPSGSQVLLDVFAKTGRVVLCFSFAIYVGVQYELLSHVVAGFQNFFAMMFATSVEGFEGYRWDNETLVFEKMDVFVSPYFDSLQKVFEEASHYNNTNAPNGRDQGWIVILSAFIQTSAVLMFAASIALMLLYFKAALLICLMTAPLFIIAGAFQATSKLFFSWLSTLISYTFAAGIAAIPVGVALNVLEDFGVAFSQAVAQTGVGGDQGLNYITTPLVALLTNGMLMFLSLRLPALAGKLVGGMISPVSGGEAGQVFSSARTALAGAKGSNLNGGAMGAGATARGPGGRFAKNSPVAGSPAHQLSMAADRGLYAVGAIKNEVLGSPRNTSGKTGSPARRAPQQSVAERRAAAKNAKQTTTPPGSSNPTS